MMRWPSPAAGSPTAPGPRRKPPATWPRPAAGARRNPDMDGDPDAMSERAGRPGLPPGRRLAGYALAAVLAPLLTIVLASLGGQLTLTGEVLAFLVAVIAVALAGGVVPA